MNITLAQTHIEPKPNSNPNPYRTQTQYEPNYPVQIRDKGKIFFSSAYGSLPENKNRQVLLIHLMAVQISLRIQFVVLR